MFGWEVLLMWFRMILLIFNV